MDLFKLNYLFNSTIELPEFNDEAETGEAIFRPRIEIIKDLNKKLLFELKTGYRGPIVIATSVIDIKQQKCRSENRAFDSSLDYFMRRFLIDEEICSGQSILTNDRLTLFCEISMLTETIKKENIFSYLQILACFEVPSALKIIDLIIDGKTRKVITREQLEQEKLEQEKLEREKLERERLEREKLEREKLEREKLEQEKLEREKLEREKLEREKLEREKLEREKLEQERIEREKLKREKLEQERLEREKLKREMLEREKLEREKLEREKLERKKLKRGQEALEKLEDYSNKISRQKLTLDHTIFTVNNIYHEHYFENANIKDSFVNTKSQSNFGDINIKSEHSDCTEMIGKLQTILSNEIKPVLDQNEQMYSEMKSSQSHDVVLIDLVISNQKLIQENKQEMKTLQSELYEMKQTKYVAQPIIKQIVDRVILLLNKIKFELNKVAVNISSTIKQVRQSMINPQQKSPQTTSDHIMLYTAPLIKYIQSVPTSDSISNKIKQSHIHKLKKVKNFLEHLPAEKCSTINPISHFESDLVALETVEQKLLDIIANCDLDKELLTNLCCLLMENKSESSRALSDNAESKGNFK